MVTNKELLFDKLYARALEDWSSEFSIQRHLLTNPSYYPSTLNEFAKISEDLSANYIGLEDEVLMSNLHHAIYCVINKIIKISKTLKLNELKQGEIKNIFDKKLLAALEKETLGWDEKDKRLINAYFLMNQST